MITKPSAACMDLCANHTISVSTAQQHILRAIEPITGSEVIPLASALHRILAQTVISPIAVPGHTNAAVDGYAIKGSDLPKEGTRQLKPVGTALAGKPFPSPIQSGQAVRIMTGAPLPEGADTIIMQEQVREKDGLIQIAACHRPGENVRHAGEDIPPGTSVLTVGKYLLPPDLGLLASLGILEVTVTRRLRVGLLSTGDEILSQGAIHEPGKIYDSNRFSLRGAITAKLIPDIIDYGIAPDNPSVLKQTIEEMARRCDVIVCSGGVSVGTADYTKEVMAQLGHVEFWKVAIKPGRPLAFGHVDGCVFFGLPGNPVAVLVTFYQFVLPALFKLAGANQPPLLPTFPAKTLERLRKKPGRTEFQRGVLERGEAGQWQVRTAGKQGSGILSSMTRGNCLIVLEHDRGTVMPGEWVEVMPFAMLM